MSAATTRRDAKPPAPRGTEDPAPRLRPRPRWAATVLVASALALLLPSHLGWAVRLVAGWDAGLVILIGEPWWVIARSDAADAERRAAVEDPGALGLFVIALVASALGLVAAVVLLRRPEDYAREGGVGLLIGLGLAAVMGGWVLLHTSFALHYARLYYADDREPRTLAFEGGPPDDLDFSYVAFTVGMSYAVSDVTASGPLMRRVVLGHALLSFVYNTAILALAITLLFGRLD